MPRVAHVTEVKLRQSRSSKSHGPARGHKWSRMRLGYKCRIVSELLTQTSPRRYSGINAMWPPSMPPSRTPQPGRGAPLFDPTTAPLRVGLKARGSSPVQTGAQRGERASDRRARARAARGAHPA
eukprot:1203113-Prymnesium_polylepis.1